MVRALLVTIAAVQVFAFAAKAQQVEVIYFGGYGATKKQMECWERGARANSRFNSDYKFRGHAYPAGSSSSFAGAVNGASRTISQIVKEINANPKKRYVVVGHSSGAAISNTVASRVKNPKQIDLVNLDGFSPSSKLQNSVASSTCMYAVGKGGRLSRNAGAMQRSCGQRAKAYRDTSGCTTPWCLHFAVVNTKASAGNYNTCSTNLSFLDHVNRAADLRESRRSNSTVRAVGNR
jgi:hypothetical protein